MAKYLVFQNDKSIGKTSPAGSPEYIACEIARTVEGDSNPVDHFIAFAENTPEATFMTLKSVLRFSVVVDQRRTELWRDEVEPIRDQIYALYDTIGDCYSNITGGIQDLDRCCENSQHFSDVDMTSSMNVDSAFESIENPSEWDFCQKLEELFEVKNLMQHHT